jgi:hypothetical protein
VIEADDFGQSRAAEAFGSDILYGYYRHDAYSLEAFVEDLEEAQQALKQAKLTPISIDNLIILNHGNQPGVFRLGKDTITPDNFYGSGYDLTFTRLGELMSDDAQIHHYGCLQAGLNVNDETVRQHDHDGSRLDRHKDGGVLSIGWEGRNMLATIACITGSTVFASSDLNSSSYTEPSEAKKDELKNVFWGPDMCLEFGVGPDLVQVNYWTAFHNKSATGSTLWNLPKWFNYASSPKSGMTPLKDSMQRIDDDWPGVNDPKLEGIALTYYMGEISNRGEAGGQTYELLRPAWWRLC